MSSISYKLKKNVEIVGNIIFRCRCFVSVCSTVVTCKIKEF